MVGGQHSIKDHSIRDVGNQLSRRSGSPCEPVDVMANPSRGQWVRIVQMTSLFQQPSLLDATESQGSSPSCGVAAPLL